MLSLDDFQKHGLAERNIEAGTTPRWPIPTIDQMESLWLNAEDKDEHVGMLKGFLYQLDFAPSADLNCNPLAFRPDPAGRQHIVVPVHDGQGRIIDLIAGPGFNDDGWTCEGRSTEHYSTSGRGAIIGFAELSKPWTGSDPCPVFYGVDAWLEDRRGVVVLKRSARELLTLAPHIRLDNWHDAADLASEFFADEPSRVSGPQDREAYKGFLAGRALDQLLKDEPLPRWLADPWGWLAERQNGADVHGRMRRRKRYEEWPHAHAEC